MAQSGICQIGAAEAPTQSTHWCPGIRDLRETHRIGNNNWPQSHGVAYNTLPSHSHKFSFSLGKELIGCQRAGLLARYAFRMRSSAGASRNS